MDYQKIKYFLKAAKTLNFSEAARQLYITPQAFGRQITILEEEMGFPLFERSKRRVRLTAAGRICYENLSGLVENLEREYEKMCEMGTRRKNQIRMGVFSALSLQKVVSPLVTSILSEFPEQNVNISLCDMGELKDQIHNGSLDLCVTAVHGMEPGWADSEKMIYLKEMPAKIVVSKYHPWVVKNEVTVEDMEKEIFTKIDLKQYSEEDYFVQIPCKEQRIVPNYESMCLALERGDCFTVMSAEADSYCEKNGKVFPLPWSPFSFQLAIVYNSSNVHAFLPRLCDFLANEIEF